MTEHSRYILRAIELSSQSLDKGDLPFGAVLVHEDRIILEAQSTVVSENDNTRHAEINLVSHACRQLAPDVLKRSTLYASTEPCPMCAGAIYLSKIPRIVYGCSSEALQQIAGPSIHMGCRKIFDCCYEGVEVIGPVDEELACDPHLNCWPHPS